MSAAVDTALATTIATATNFATHVPGGCWNAVRPQGSQFPVCVYTLVSSLDGQSFSDSGVEFLDYDVRIIAPSNAQANVGAMLEAIYAKLERQSLSISGRTHMQTLRVRRLPVYSETVSGVSYVHRGMTFRIWVA